MLMLTSDIRFCCSCCPIPTYCIATPPRLASMNNSSLNTQYKHIYQIQQQNNRPSGQFLLYCAIFTALVSHFCDICSCSYFDILLLWFFVLFPLKFHVLLFRCAFICFTSLIVVVLLTEVTERQYFMVFAQGLLINTTESHARNFEALNMLSYIPKLNNISVI